MIINIQLDTREDLSVHEKCILAALAGAEFEPDDWPAVNVETPSEISEDEVAAAVEKRKAVEEAAAVAKRKAAVEAEKKAAEAEKRKAEAAEKRKAAAEKKAAEEAEKKAAAEAEKASEEYAGESAEAPEDEGTPAVLESDGPTLDDAVKLASSLISSGNSAAVKSVLKEIGVRKVGELPQDKIAAFIDQLDAL